MKRRSSLIDLFVNNNRFSLKNINSNSQNIPTESDFLLDAFAGLRGGGNPPEITQEPLSNAHGT
jgi:hypothetical protein